MLIYGEFSKLAENGTKMAEMAEKKAKNRAYGL